MTKPIQSIPCVITYDDIKPGDLIEAEYPDRSRVSFVATPSGDSWTSPGGEWIITPVGTPGLNPDRTIRLLERPEPMPPVSTTVGTVITATLEDGRRLDLIRVDASDRPWWSVAYSRCYRTDWIVEWELVRVSVPPVGKEWLKGHEARYVNTVLHCACGWRAGNPGASVDQDHMDHAHHVLRAAGAWSE